MYMFVSLQLLCRPTTIRLYVSQEGPVITGCGEARLEHYFVIKRTVLFAVVVQSSLFCSYMLSVTCEQSLAFRIQVCAS
jgi:hypothetical protein